MTAGTILLKPGLTSGSNILNYISNVILQHLRQIRLQLDYGSLEPHNREVNLIHHAYPGQYLFSIGILALDHIV